MQLRLTPARVRYNDHDRWSRLQLRAQQRHRDQHFGFGGNDAITVSRLAVLTTLQADGGDGNDTLSVASTVTTPTVLLGGNGNDTLTGGAANDLLTGGAGNDTYAFNTNLALGSDTINEAGGGTDTLDFSATTTRTVAVDLSNAAAQVVNAGLTLTLSSGSTMILSPTRISTASSRKSTPGCSDSLPTTVAWQLVHHGRQVRHLPQRSVTLRTLATSLRLRRSIGRNVCEVRRPAHNKAHRPRIAILQSEAALLLSVACAAPTIYRSQSDQIGLEATVHSIRSFPNWELIFDGGLAIGF